MPKEKGKSILETCEMNFMNIKNPSMILYTDIYEYMYINMSFVINCVLYLY